MESLRIFLMAKLDISAKGSDCKQNFESFSFIVHDFLATRDIEQAFVQCLDETLIDEGDSKSRVSRLVFYLIEMWLTRGKPPHFDTLLDLKVLLRRRGGDCDTSKIIREMVDSLLSPEPATVPGRWKSVSPQEDLLFWLNWEIDDIVIVLTEVCLPFYSVRAWEFAPPAFGPNVQDLNCRANSLTLFVASSTLVACAVSRKMGVFVAEKWLSITTGLRELQNYHMLFAVQMGLSKNQIDRQHWLWDSLPRKAQKIKAELDALFDPLSRFSHINALHQEMLADML